MTASRVEYTDVHPSDSRYATVVQIIGNSFLDKTYRSTWTIHNLRTVKNLTLFQQYKAKTEELKRAGRDVTEHDMFTCYKTMDLIHNILEHGLQTRQSSFNFLGDSQRGVNLCKHADIQLKAAENTGQEECYLIIYKVVLGKSLRVYPSSDNQQLAPSMGYDSHISSLDVDCSIQLGQQAIRSQVYCYEFNNNQLSSCPRHVLPYVVVCYKRSMSLPTTMSIPTQMAHPNVQMLPPPLVQMAPAPRAHNLYNLPSLDNQIIHDFQQRMPPRNPFVHQLHQQSAMSLQSPPPYPGPVMQYAGMRLATMAHTAANISSSPMMTPVSRPMDRPATGMRLPYATPQQFVNHMSTQQRSTYATVNNHMPPNVTAPEHYSFNMSTMSMAPSSGMSIPLQVQPIIQTSIPSDVTVSRTRPSSRVDIGMRLPIVIQPEEPPGLTLDNGPNYTQENGHVYRAMSRPVSALTPPDIKPDIRQLERHLNRRKSYDAEKIIIDPEEPVLPPHSSNMPETSLLPSSNIAPVEDHQVMSAALDLTSKNKIIPTVMVSEAMASETLPNAEVISAIDLSSNSIHSPTKPTDNSNTDVYECVEETVDDQSPVKLSVGQDASNNLVGSVVDKFLDENADKIPRVTVFLEDDDDDTLPDIPTIIIPCPPCTPHSIPVEAVTSKPRAIIGAKKQKISRDAISSVKLKRIRSRDAISNRHKLFKDFNPSSILLEAINEKPIFKICSDGSIEVYKDAYKKQNDDNSTEHPTDCTQSLIYLDETLSQLNVRDLLQDLDGKIVPDEFSVGKQVPDSGKNSRTTSSEVACSSKTSLEELPPAQDESATILKYTEYKKVNRDWEKLVLDQRFQPKVIMKDIKTIVDIKTLALPDAKVHNSNDDVGLNLKIADVQSLHGSDILDDSDVKLSISKDQSQPEVKSKPLITASKTVGLRGRQKRKQIDHNPNTEADCRSEGIKLRPRTAPRVVSTSDDLNDEIDKENKRSKRRKTKFKSRAVIEDDSSSEDDKQIKQIKSITNVENKSDKENKGSKRRKTKFKSRAVIEDDSSSQDDKQIKSTTEVENKTDQVVKVNDETMSISDHSKDGIDGLLYEKHKLEEELQKLQKNDENSDAENVPGAEAVETVAPHDSIRKSGDIENLSDSCLVMESDSWLVIDSDKSSHAEKAVDRESSASRDGRRESRIRDSYRDSSDTDSEKSFHRSRYSSSRHRRHYDDRERRSWGSRSPREIDRHRHRKYDSRRDSHDRRYSDYHYKSSRDRHRCSPDRSRRYYSPERYKSRHSPSRRRSRSCDRRESSSSHRWKHSYELKEKKSPVKEKRDEKHKFTVDSDAGTETNMDEEDSEKSTVSRNEPISQDKDRQIGTASESESTSNKPPKSTPAKEPDEWLKTVETILLNKSDKDGTQLYDGYTAASSDTPMADPGQWMNKLIRMNQQGKSPVSAATKSGVMRSPPTVTVASKNTGSNENLINQPPNQKMSQKEITELVSKALTVLSPQLCKKTPNTAESVTSTAETSVSKPEDIRLAYGLIRRKKKHGSNQDRLETTTTPTLWGEHPSGMPPINQTLEEMHQSAHCSEPPLSNIPTTGIPNLPVVNIESRVVPHKSPVSCHSDSTAKYMENQMSAKTNVPRKTLLPTPTSLHPPPKNLVTNLDVIQANTLAVVTTCAVNCAIQSGNTPDIRDPRRRRPPLSPRGESGSDVDAYMTSPTVIEVDPHKSLAGNPGRSKIAKTWEASLTTPNALGSESVALRDMMKKKERKSEHRKVSIDRSERILSIDDKFANYPPWETTIFKIDIDFPVCYKLNNLSVDSTDPRMNKKIVEGPKFQRNPTIFCRSIPLDRVDQSSAAEKLLIKISNTNITTTGSPQSLNVEEKKPTKGHKAAAMWSEVLTKPNTRQSIVVDFSEVVFPRDSEIGNCNTDVRRYMEHVWELSTSESQALNEEMTLLLNERIQYVEDSLRFDDPTEGLDLNRRLNLIASGSLPENAVRELQIEEDMRVIKDEINAKRQQLELSMKLGTLPEDAMRELRTEIDIRDIQFEKYNKELEHLNRYYKSSVVEVLPEIFRLTSEHGKFISVEGNMLFLTSALKKDDCIRLYALLEEINEYKRVAEKPKTTIEDQLHAKVRLGWLHTERKETLCQLCLNMFRSKESLMQRFLDKLAWCRKVVGVLSTRPSLVELYKYICERTTHLDLYINVLQKVERKDNGVWVPANNKLRTSDTDMPPNKTLGKQKQSHRSREQNDNPPATKIVDISTTSVKYHSVDPTDEKGELSADIGSDLSVPAPPEKLNSQFTFNETCSILKCSSKKDTKKDTDSITDLDWDESALVIDFMSDNDNKDSHKIDNDEKRLLDIAEMRLPGASMVNSANERKDLDDAKQPVNLDCIENRNDNTRPNSDQNIKPVNSEHDTLNVSIVTPKKSEYQLTISIDADEDKNIHPNILPGDLKDSEHRVLKAVSPKRSECHTPMDMDIDEEDDHAIKCYGNIPGILDGSGDKVAQSTSATDIGNSDVPINSSDTPTTISDDIAGCQSIGGNSTDPKTALSNEIETVLKNIRNSVTQLQAISHVPNNNIINSKPNVGELIFTSVNVHNDVDWRPLLSPNCPHIPTTEIRQSGSVTDGGHGESFEEQPIFHSNMTGKVSTSKSPKKRTTSPRSSSNLSSSVSSANAILTKARMYRKNSSPRKGQHGFEFAKKTRWCANDEAIEISPPSGESRKSRLHSHSKQIHSSPRRYPYRSGYAEDCVPHDPYLDARSSHVFESSEFPSRSHSESRPMSRSPGISVGKSHSMTQSRSPLPDRSRKGKFFRGRNSRNMSSRQDLPSNCSASGYRGTKWRGGNGHSYADTAHAYGDHQRPVDEEPVTNISITDPTVRRIISGDRMLVEMLADREKTNRLVDLLSSEDRETILRLANEIQSGGLNTN